MKKSIKTIIAGLLMVPALTLGLALVTPVGAVTCEGGTTIADGASCVKTGGPTDMGAVVTTIVNTALYVIGILSVLMLIFGGIKYTMSGGNEKEVTAAKNTILYAIIGIVIALLAYAIVNFVITTLVPGSV